MDQHPLSRFGLESSRRGFLTCLAGLLAPAAGAAYISEIDLAGPAGQSVELTGLDDDPGGHTLLFINANPFSPASFGKVLDVVRLPAGSSPVTLITDAPWPDASTPATPVSTLGPSSGGSTLNLAFARLLVVIDGAISVSVEDAPLTDPAAAARYDAAAVTDWLVLGSGPLADQYASNGHDISAINAGLGIDLLARLADKEAGRVIARSQHPGRPLDLDDLFIGTPNEQGAFPAVEGYSYITSPGLANLPLIPTTSVPEPGAAVCLLLGVAMNARRRRPRPCPRG